MKILKVYEDEYTEQARQQERLGVSGIDDLAEGEARKFKLEKIRDRLSSYVRGWEGNSRR